VFPGVDDFAHFKSQSAPQKKLTMDPAKLAKLQAQAAANRIGGKGTVRRKIVRKTKPSAAQDDKKASGRFEEIERAADSRCRRGQHVQRGWKRTALYSS